MQIQYRSPQSPLEWFVTILAFGVVVALAFLLASVVLVVLGVAIVVGPIIAWWRRRKGPEVEGEVEIEIEENRGKRVLDVEFEVDGEDQV